MGATPAQLNGEEAGFGATSSSQKEGSDVGGIEGAFLRCLVPFLISPRSADEMVVTDITTSTQLT